VLLAIKPVVIYRWLVTTSGVVLTVGAQTRSTLQPMSVHIVSRLVLEVSHSSSTLWLVFICYIQSFFRSCLLPIVITSTVESCLLLLAHYVFLAKTISENLASYNGSTSIKLVDNDPQLSLDVHLPTRKRMQLWHRGNLGMYSTSPNRLLSEVIQAVLT
jgi:hypothetical protein